MAFRNKKKCKMRTVLICIAFITFLISCEKSSISTTSVYTARITGYDLNCSACILSFPFDSQEVSKRFGSSSENLFLAVNLNKNELEIGQMMKVEIRKAEPDELTPCLTLYPSSGFETVFVTRFEDFDSFNITDTILMPVKECRFNRENQTYICFESVVGDSRCPDGAECIWAGDAKVKLKYLRSNDDPLYFTLNTNPAFTNDTIIDGYKYSLLNLYPYPSLIHHTDQKDYKAELLIEKATE